jgi:oligopeptide transport system permease protein
MIALAFRRLLAAIPTLAMILIAAFTLMHLAPGGPFTKERQMPPEIERRLVERYGLDKPVHEQLASYLVGLARGDLGPSMIYKDKDVLDIISEGFPTSALIGASAMALALALGVSLGVWAGLNQNKLWDSSLMAAAVIGVCLPPLVMGPMLSLVFGVNLGWLPTVGLHRDEYGVRFLVLPVLTLALPQVAIISRLTRAGLIEAMRANPIRTARAKGLPEWRIVLRHALPVALLPVVSYLGPAAAGVLAGSFVVETVFQLPGVGRQFIIGALDRDYTMVAGVVLLYAALIILFNLAADLGYRALDPRARTT